MTTGKTGGKVGRPRAADARTDRARALKASALDLLARNGFDSVTIRQIGDAAGLTTAVIYYYFADKDDLLSAAIEHAIDEAFDHFETMARNVDDPASLIHDWLQTHVELAGPLSKIMKLNLEHAMSDKRSARIDAAISRFYEREREVLVGCIEDGIAREMFDCVDATEISVLVSTFLDGAMVRSQILGGFDLAGAVNVFETLLWARLGYRP